MNTEKLIEIAKKCGDRSINCMKECPYFTLDANCVTNLLYDIADKLAMAMEDLKRDCKTCLYFNLPSRQMPCAICVDRNKWEWRGNDESESEST